jgi:hypothetical protein
LFLGLHGVTTKKKVFIRVPYVRTSDLTTNGNLPEWTTFVFVFVCLGVAKGYGLDGQGSIPGKKFVAAPQLPDRLWGPHSLLFNEYQGLLLKR